MYVLQLQYASKEIVWREKEGVREQDAIKSVYITQHSPHTHNIFMLLIPILPKRPRAPICNLNNASPMTTTPTGIPNDLLLIELNRDQKRHREREWAKGRSQTDRRPYNKYTHLDFTPVGIN